MIQEGPPIAPLRSAMQAAVETPQETVLGDLLAIISESDLVVPVRGEDAEGVELAVQEGSDGATTFFAFCDLEGLHAAVPAATPYSIPGRVVVKP